MKFIPTPRVGDSVCYQNKEIGLILQDLVPFHLYYIEDNSSISYQYRVQFLVTIQSIQAPIRQLRCLISWHESDDEARSYGVESRWEFMNELKNEGVSGKMVVK